jgi:hypothetical protein
MKKFTIIMVSLALLAMSSLYASNTMFGSWKQFKPGSFVTYKCTTDAAGVKTEAWLTYTLKNVGANKVTLELKTKTVTMGMTVDGPTQTVEFDASDNSTEMNIPGLPTAVPTINAAGAQIGGRSEKMTIKGQTIEVQTTTVKTAAAESALWYSDSVPGGMVKAQTKTIAADVLMEVMDFKVIK